MTAETFRQSQETQTQPDLLLVEFQEDGSGVVERAVLNNEDVIFGGNTYYAAQFDIGLPNDGETQALPSLTFSNVDREAGKLSLSAQDRISCRLIHLDGSDYTVSGGVRTYYTALSDTSNMMVVADVAADILNISGSLAPRLNLDLPSPLFVTNEKTFPGLYL